MLYGIYIFVISYLALGNVLEYSLKCDMNDLMGLLVTSQKSFPSEQKKC